MLDARLARFLLPARAERHRGLLAVIVALDARLAPCANDGEGDYRLE